MTEQNAPNLYQRILGIMGDIDYIQKGPKSVNGQYRFASHDQVTAAIHPLLVKHGVLALPSVVEESQEGNRTKAKVRVGFINADNPTEHFFVEFFGYGIDSGDKGPGKAISYALKYCLLKTFHLETGDDPDQDANARYEPVKCLDFDLAIGEYTKDDKSRARLKKFLEYSSRVTNKHVEDIKREALTRLPDFVSALKKWNPKESEDE